jgi:hypothetical protein
MHTFVGSCSCRCACVLCVALLAVAFFGCWSKSAACTYVLDASIQRAVQIDCSYGKYAYQAPSLAGYVPMCVYLLIRMRSKKEKKKCICVRTRIKRYLNLSLRYARCACIYIPSLSFVFCLHGFNSSVSFTFVLSFFSNWAEIRWQDVPRGLDARQGPMTLKSQLNQPKCFFFFLACLLACLELFLRLWWSILHRQWFHW